MAFTVAFHTLQARTFPDGDTPEVVRGGALKITRQDGSIVYFGPTVWVEVDYTPPANPGVHGWPAEDVKNEGQEGAPFWREGDPTTP